MITTSQIEELGRRIGRDFNADKIVLFDSYADGVATNDSDVDLLVVARTSLPPRQAVCRRAASGGGLPGLV